MDRSRRGGANGKADVVPTASRLTVKPRGKNRRRAGSVWSRMPQPRVLVDACGRAVRRTVPVLIAAAAVTAVGAGGVAGYKFVTSSPRFAITEITVNGERHLTDDQIRAALQVKVGHNVFAADLDKGARTLRALPWVASASIHRELPHSLVIDIEEHSPAAVVELGGLYLADAQGRPFKRVAADEGAGLPVITGLAREAYEADPAGTAQTVTTALAALATWQLTPGRPVIAEISVDSHHTLTLLTAERSTAIQLGPLAPPPALLPRMAAFDAVWAELPDDERSRASTLHFDARTDQVTVALTPTVSS
jgi:cell division protein FtsQ